MRHFKFLAASVALTLLAGAALADPPAPAAGGSTVAAGAGPGASNATGAVAARPPKPVRDPNEMVCHTIVPTGSRLGGERVCQPRHVWEDQARQAQDSINRQTNRADQHNMKGS